MVCERCILTIRNEFEVFGIRVNEVQLGMVTYDSNQKSVSWELVELRLNSLGFQLVQDRKRAIVKEVKNLVEEIYSGNYDFPYSFRFSKVISDRLLLDYDFISKTFSVQENMTIEKFLMDYRLEKVKEFLMYSSKSISDISYNLGFSSIAHMSRQFKSFTGLTPSYFRSISPTKQIFSAPTPSF